MHIYSNYYNCKAYILLLNLFYNIIFELQKGRLKHSHEKLMPVFNRRLTEICT